MIMERRKVSAVHREFVHQLDGLLRLDEQNQRRYRAGPGRSGRATLTKGQMFLLTEGIFMKAFSHYEKFIEDTFILYTRNRPTKSGRNVPSYIAPKDGQHARDMLKSNMPFLEWNSPDNVIRRCETYLEDGDPIKLSLTAHSSKLQNMRKVRNAIAHHSTEAQRSYNNVVLSELMISPLNPIPPGEFLLRNDPRTPSSYFLLIYMSTLRSFGDLASG